MIRSHLKQRCLWSTFLSSARKSTPANHSRLRQSNKPTRTQKLMKAALAKREKTSASKQLVVLLLIGWESSEIFDWPVVERTRETAQVCSLLILIYWVSYFILIRFGTFCRSGILHGIVLWMDFNLAEKLSVTSGLQQVGSKSKGIFVTSLFPLALFNVRRSLQKASF